MTGLFIALGNFKILYKWVIFPNKRGIGIMRRKELNEVSTGISTTGRTLSTGER